MLAATAGPPNRVVLRFAASEPRRRATADIVFVIFHIRTSSRRIDAPPRSATNVVEPVQQRGGKPYPSRGERRAMLGLVSFNVHLRAAKLPPMFHFVAALRPRNRSSIDGCSSPVGGGPISRARGRVGASARPGGLRALRASSNDGAASRR